MAQAEGNQDQAGSKAIQYFKDALLACTKASAIYEGGRNHLPAQCRLPRKPGGGHLLRNKAMDDVSASSNHRQANLIGTPDFRKLASGGGGRVRWPKWI